jgi:hypothetical protein
MGGFHVIVSLMVDGITALSNKITGSPESITDFNGIEYIILITAIQKKYCHHCRVPSLAHLP